MVQCIMCGVSDVVYREQREKALQIALQGFSGGKLRLYFKFSTFAKLFHFQQLSLLMLWCIFQFRQHYFSWRIEWPLVHHI